MNYKVLYRKYRPDNFENIVGQDYIIKTLKNSVISGNVSHAYIFSGPRGTGKTSTAKVFAKTINCLNQKDGSPCGKCDFCKNYNENPDIIEIDAASNNGVDEIRNLIDNVKLTPSNGKYKVYIIDEVHMLTTSAFNALLLTLEEPPSHVIFILATTNIENLPITIISRCQRFDFKKIDVNCITNKLKDLCKLEKIKYDEDALQEIAYLSDGGLRDSLSLLDQLSKNDEKITVKLIEDQIKIVSRKEIVELIDSIDKNDANAAINMLKEFKSRSTDYKTLIRKIIDELSVLAENIKIKGKKTRLSYKDIKNLIFELSEGLTKINVNVEPYTILEIILLDYFANEINVEKSNKIEEKQTNNNNDEEKQTISNVENSKSNKNENDFEEMINIRINNCFVNAKKSYLEEIKLKYNEILNKKMNGKIKSILSDATVVASSDKYVIISCNLEKTSEIANKMIDEIEKVFENTINSNYKLIFVSEDRWNIEKNKYVNNIKNNKKYEMLEEKKYYNNDEPTINDVFNVDKVEII